MINEMLKYGETIEPAFGGRKRCTDEVDLEDGAAQIFYLSEKDFAEICFERKSKKDDGHK